MKTRFSLLFLLISTIIYANATEVVLTGGIQDNHPNVNNVLSDAINDPQNLNGNGTITIKGDIYINDNFTIPEGIELNFFKSNKLIIKSGVTLTILGTVKAGVYPIFSNGGTIVGSPRITFAYPEWFGAKIDDTVDDLEFIQDAIDFSNGSVNMINGEYILNGPLNVENCHLNLNKAKLKFKFTDKDECLRMKNNSSVMNGTIEFDGSLVTNSYAGNFQCPIIIGDYPTGAGYRNVKLEGLTIITNKSNGNGIMVTGDSNQISIESIYFPASQYLGRGILMHWGGADSISTNTPLTAHPHNVTIDNIKFDNMTLDMGLSDANKKEDTGGIFVSGAYSIKASNVQAKELHWRNGVINVYAGDHGKDYASTEIKSLINENVIFENFNLEVAYSRAVKVDCLQGQNAIGKDVLPGPTLINVVAVGSNNNTAHGITVAKSSNTTIKNCKISRFNYGLITDSVVSNLTISGGAYFDNRKHGFSISNADAPINTLIYNVKVYNNNTDNGSYAGIYVGNSKNCSLIGNIIGEENDTQKWGVRIDANSKRSILENNYVKDAKISAFSIGSSTTYGLVYRFKGNSTDIHLYDDPNNPNDDRYFQTGVSPMIIDTRMIENSQSLIREFIGREIPTQGTWNKGDRIYNNLVNNTNFRGYLCVQGGVGTSAVWTTF